MSTTLHTPATYEAGPSHERADKFDRVWSQLSSADRHVLLGHDRDTLSAADKARLAQAAAAIGKARREATSKTFKPHRRSRAVGE